MIISPISVALWDSYRRLVLEAGVKISSHAFRGLRKLLSCHSWLPTQLSDNGKRINLTGKLSKNICVRFFFFLKAPHPTLISPMFFTSVIVCTAWWGMVRCQRVLFGRPCRSPPTTNLTTWWPSWTSTAWAKVTLHPCSITLRNIRNAVKLSGNCA